MKSALVRFLCCRPQVWRDESSMLSLVKLGGDMTCASLQAKAARWRVVLFERQECGGARRGTGDWA